MSMHDFWTQIGVPMIGGALVALVIVVTVYFIRRW
jgi:hypothetical protein